MDRRSYGRGSDTLPDEGGALSPEGYAECYEQVHALLDTVEETVQDVVAYRQALDVDLAVLGRRWNETVEFLDDIADHTAELHEQWGAYRYALELCREVRGWDWLDEVDELTEQVEEVVDGYENATRAFYGKDIGAVLNAFPEAEPYVRALGWKQRRDVPSEAALRAVDPGNHPVHIVLRRNLGGDGPTPQGDPVTYAGLTEKLDKADEVTYRIRHPGTGEETRIDEELAATALDAVQGQKVTHPGMTYDGYDRTAEIGFGWEDGVQWETMEPEPSHFKDGATLILEWEADYRNGIDDIPLILQAVTGRMTLPNPEEVAERLGVDPAKDASDFPDQPHKGRL